MRINSSSDTPASTDGGSASGQTLSTTDSQPFSTPPERPTLKDNEVHVWRCDLDQPTGIRQSLMCSLAEDERARAGRFHFDKDRNHFIIARGALRSILGSYLNLAPSELRFSYG